jgi:bacillithiol synthase
MARSSPLMELQVVTEPLGGSALSLAAQRGEAPDHWYRPRPSDVTEWREHARNVAEQFATGTWLSALEPALAPLGEAAARLRRVAAGKGVLVTTGQQPGLFGGPAYTFSKAVSVLALADELEATTGIPVAPVFWAATDDADFDEARWTKVVLDGNVVRLVLDAAPLAGTPMSLAPLGDVSSQLPALEASCGSAAFVRALDAARQAYRPGATIGDAFLGLLRALIEPLGVAVLDASHASVRRQGTGVLREALRRASDVAAALRSRVAEIRARGFEPQVLDVEDLSLVFSLRGGRKWRLPIGEAQMVAETADPEMLSPNVLLRPVLERAILPTVAYAAGPAELAYFAQVSAVADAIGAERPLAVPRWSTTIIEPHIGRILRRLRIHHTDLRDAHALEGRVARAALPAAVASELGRIRAAVDHALRTLATDRDAASLVPDAAVVGAKGSLLLRLQRLERRYVAAVKRREQNLMREIATARAHLFPDGERQERALNFVPMLARYGPPLFEAMRRAAAVHADTLIGAAAEVLASPGEVVRGAGRQP